MHSAAGFRGLLAVAMAVIEMAVVISMVGGAPVSLDRDVSEGGDRKTLHSTHSNAERQGNTVPTNNSPERREKFLKILSDLGELQRSISSSMGGRVTAVLRGNKANSRGSGKKNKVAVSEETQKAPTLPPVDGGGTVSGSSDRPPEQKNRGGKDLKKIATSVPKETEQEGLFLEVLLPKLTSILHPPPSRGNSHLTWSEEMTHAANHGSDKPPPPAHTP